MARVWNRKMRRALKSGNSSKARHYDLRSMLRYSRRGMRGKLWSK